MSLSFKSIQKQIESSPLFNSPQFVKYKMYVIPGVVLIVSILISTLVTIPQIFRLFETFKTIDELNTQNEFFRNKVATLQSLNKDEYQTDLETALVALPVDKDIPGVSGEILTAVSGSGLSLNGISFANQDSSSDRVQEFQLRVEVSGTNDQLKNFIERVKIAPRIIKISSIEVSQSKTDSLAATIAFVTLYQPLPADIGSVDLPVPQISQADLQVLADIEAKTAKSPGIAAGNTAGSGPVGKLNPFAP